MSQVFVWGNKYVLFLLCLKLKQTNACLFHQFGGCGKEVACQPVQGDCVQLLPCGIISRRNLSKRYDNPPPTPSCCFFFSPFCQRTTYAYMKVFCFWQMSAGRLLIWLFWIPQAAGRRVFEMPTLSPGICCPEWLNYSKVSCIWLVKRKNEYHLHLSWLYGWTPESPSRWQEKKFTLRDLNCLTDLVHLVHLKDFCKSARQS